MEQQEAPMSIPVQTKRKSRKKLIGILTVAFLLVGFAGYVIYYNMQGGILNLPENPANEKQNPSSSGVQLNPNPNALLYEELDISEEWVRELSIPEGTYLQMDFAFDNPVKVNFLIPLDTGNQYLKEFSRRGWVSQGKGFEHTLRATPETSASGTIVITELGRI